MEFFEDRSMMMTERLYTSYSLQYKRGKQLTGLKLNSNLKSHIVLFVGKVIMMMVIVCGLLA
jgi:hypothetical protein